MKCKGSGSTRTCTAGGRTFTLHDKSNKSAKASRGRAHGFKKGDAAAALRKGLTPGTVAFGRFMGKRVADRNE